MRSTLESSPLSTMPAVGCGEDAATSRGPSMRSTLESSPLSTMPAVGGGEGATMSRGPSMRSTLESSPLATMPDVGGGDDAAVAATVAAALGAALGVPAMAVAAVGMGSPSRNVVGVGVGRFALWFIVGEGDGATDAAMSRGPSMRSTLESSPLSTMNPVVGSGEGATTSRGPSIRSTLESSPLATMPAVGGGDDAAVAATVAAALGAALGVPARAVAAVGMGSPSRKVVGMGVGRFALWFIVGEGDGATDAAMSRGPSMRSTLESSPLSTMNPVVGSGEGATTTRGPSIRSTLESAPLATMPDVGGGDDAAVAATVAAALGAALGVPARAVAAVGMGSPSRNVVGVGVGRFALWFIVGEGDGATDVATLRGPSMRSTLESSPLSTMNPVVGRGDGAPMSGRATASEASSSVLSVLPVSCRLIECVAASSSDSAFPSMSTRSGACSDALFAGESIPASESPLESGTGAHTVSTQTASVPQSAVRRAHFERHRRLRRSSDERLGRLARRDHRHRRLRRLHQRCRRGAADKQKREDALGRHLAAR